ncbi:hypothetical protein ASPCADRAFT_209306 [Aspergillus carbonarius ITEM 5010]|uniref:Uncharacterized protein n=1 Tax=Aspergillus carbonarius (strain ITEM 5010) TaxID=602072 RepID=A0A1R3RFW6_ASPC5|nr:hypothetical protein ASPCADRAFT_209306 [Aspergillus carbonarius ITEM 5010]
MGSNEDNGQNKRIICSPLESVFQPARIVTLLPTLSSLSIVLLIIFASGWFLVVYVV